MKKLMKNISLISLSLGLTILGNTWVTQATEVNNKANQPTTNHTLLAKFPKVGTPKNTSGAATRGGANDVSMMEDWGLTLVDCKGFVVSIFLNNTEYCAKPSKDLKIGKYLYNRADDRLDPIPQYKPKDANLTLIEKLGLNPISCASAQAVVSITIDNRQYCANPTNSISAGNYIYDRTNSTLAPVTGHNN
jgi:hypothetical protein